MVFSSIPFLFFFLPLCLILYFAVPFLWGLPWKGSSRLNDNLENCIPWKNGVLLSFSLIFYAWGEPVYIVLMLFASAVDYTNGRLMERFGTTKVKRTAFLCCSVVINLSVLAFFKYADFLITTLNGIFGTQIEPLGLGLPVGISFYTFQTMSYIIDLYRGEVKAERNYFAYLTYVSMFPQLVAGPIVRFADIQERLHKRTSLVCEVEQGLTRFVQGLFKKVLIANQVGALWEEVRQLGAAQTSVASAWLGALCFTLQLYFDFSAYSDMAIGMGQMLGFHFNENFRYPLTAISVTDFWRRWHISLSTWFRDYVYIPLGGNRAGRWRHLRNIAVVWTLTGLWHGASWNFVLWGMYYGILLALEKYVWGKALAKLPRILQHVYAFLIVVFGFVVFAITDMNELGTYITLLFGVTGKGIIDMRFWWYLRNYGVVLLAACVLAWPVYPWLQNRAALLERRAGIVLSVISGVGSIFLFVLTIAYLVNDTYNPFLYFRF